MIDIDNLSMLITAFRAETEQHSITPDVVGSLLQKILDKLASISPSDILEVEDLHNIKAISSLKSSCTSLLADVASLQKETRNIPSIKDNISRLENDIKSLVRNLNKLASSNDNIAWLNASLHEFEDVIDGNRVWVRESYLNDVLIYRSVTPF